jgi:lipoate-protein ligase A
VRFAPVQLLTAAHPGDPARDVAITHGLLRRVAARELPATARVYRPGPTLAFGKLDAHARGYEAATRSARAHGFVPMLRLGGGRAAAYHEGCLVVEFVAPQDGVVSAIADRFAAGSTLLVDALARVGVEAAIGELAGEYCPGAWSVHAGGVKLAGPAQRSIRGAALWTAFVAVEDGARLRAVLTDVYAALELDWQPSTAGAAEDVRPGVTVAAVQAAVVTALGDPSPG